MSGKGVRGIRPTHVVLDEVEEWGVAQQHTAAGIPRTRSAESRRANFDRAQLDAIDWEAVPKSFAKYVAQSALWRVFTTEHVQYGACYVSTVQHVLVLHPDTWRVINFSPDVTRTFLTNFTAGAAGMKFLVMDSGPYGEAARLAAERDGKTLEKKDAIDSVATLAQSLIVQASGLASGATELQLKVFAERYAELQTKLQDIEGRVARVRSLVDLAGDAVMGACD